MITWNKSKSKGTIPHNSELSVISIDKPKGLISYRLTINGTYLTANADKSVVVKFAEDYFKNAIQESK